MALGPGLALSVDDDPLGGDRLVVEPSVLEGEHDDGVEGDVGAAHLQVQARGGVPGLAGGDLKFMESIDRVLEDA